MILTPYKIVSNRYSLRYHDVSGSFHDYLLQIQETPLHAFISMGKNVSRIVPRERYAWLARVIPKRMIFYKIYLSLCNALLALYKVKLKTIHRHLYNENESALVFQLLFTVTRVSFKVGSFFGRLLHQLFIKTATPNMSVVGSKWDN